MSNNTVVYTTNDHEGENSHNSTVNDGWTSYLSSVIRKWKRIWSRFPCRAKVSDSITLIISYFLYHLAISWTTVRMRSVSCRGFVREKSVCLGFLPLLSNHCISTFKAQGFYYHYYDFIYNWYLLQKQNLTAFV